MKQQVRMGREERGVGEGIGSERWVVMRERRDGGGGGGWEVVCGGAMEDSSADVGGDWWVRAGMGPE